MGLKKLLLKFKKELNLRCLNFVESLKQTTILFWLGHISLCKWKINKIKKIYKLKK